LRAVAEVCDGVALVSNKERVLDLPGGFQVKGTLFADTEEGITAISSGDFEFTNQFADELDGFSGFGSFLLPDVGAFKGNVDLADLFGAQLNYGSGEAFKNRDEDLPLVEEDCYFQMTLEETSGFGPGKNEYPFLIKNTAISMNTMYLQPEIPAILIKGDMDQYGTEDRPQRIDESGKKKFKPRSQNIKKKFSVKDVHIGIAAKPHFVFTPFTFSDKLERIVGGTNFQSFQGSLYLKGTIPVKKYPFEITGEAVVESTSATEGILNVLEGSFEESFYDIGVNGTLTFGHALLDILPVETRVDLGQATYQMSVALDDTYVRFGGEYDTDFVGELLGPDFSRILTPTTARGKMYGNIGTDPKDWQFYIDTDMTMNIPGLGESILSTSVLHFTPEHTYINFNTILPYGIGETEITGELFKDGTFYLTGTAMANLEIADASLAADLLITISNDGLFLEGMASLPGGVSDFKISGEITEDCMILRGEQMTDIDFGGGARLKTDLKLEASTKTGIYLSGALETPFDVTMISVEGRINRDGLLLTGIIDNTVDFGVTELNADLSISASTSTGARVSGVIDVPLVIIGGNIDVSGSITGPTSFSLAANAGVFMDFGPTSAEVGVCYAFDQSQIKLGGNAQFTWTKKKEQEDDPDETDTQGLAVLINPNWGNNTVDICIEIPVLGEHCL